MKGRTCDMISLTVFVPGRGIGLCVGLVTELFVSATTYWYLAACMQMRSHSKRAREIETYIGNLTKFVVDGREIGGSDAGDIGRLGGGECCRIGDEDLRLSSSQVFIFLQREVIGRLGKEGEGERTRGDTLGCTPCLRASRQRGRTDVSTCRGCMHCMDLFLNVMRHSSILCAYCLDISRGLYAALKYCTPRWSCPCTFQLRSLHLLSHHEFNGTICVSTFGRRV
jgi:hypothetical protein